MFRGWFNKNNAVELGDDDDSDSHKEALDSMKLEESLPVTKNEEKDDTSSKPGATTSSSWFTSKSDSHKENPEERPTSAASSWFARSTSKSEDDEEKPKAAPAPAPASSLWFAGTKTEEKDKAAAKTTSSWFGTTTKSVENKDQGGLGGFGEVNSFSADDAFDPRAIPETFPVHQQKAKSEPVVSDPDPSSGSEDVDDDDDDDDDDCSDDQTMDESTIGGPLFDESAYSVNEDEYSVDTFDVSAQEGEWRQKKANDFLADFYAERAEQKKKKQAEKEELIASKNKKTNAAASLANTLANAASVAPGEETRTDDDGFPTFPSNDDSFSRPSPEEISEEATKKEAPKQAEESQANTSDEVQATPQRRLSTGMPRRLSAAGAPKIESIPENGELEPSNETDDALALEALPNSGKDNTTFDDSFAFPCVSSPEEVPARNSFRGSSDDTMGSGSTLEAGNVSHETKGEMQDTYQAGDSDIDFGYNASFDHSMSVVSDDGTFADCRFNNSISTDGRSRRSGRSSRSHATKSSRRSSVESTGTFADYTPTRSRRHGRRASSETAESYDADSHELEEADSDEEDEEEDVLSEEEEVDSSEEEEEEEEEDDDNDNDNEADHVSNEFDLSADLTAGFGESASSANFEENAADLVAHESVESPPEFPNKEEQRPGEDTPQNQSSKTQKGVFAYDSDVSDPDEPEPLTSRPSQLFGYLDASAQQAAFEDDEASQDSTPALPKRSRSGEILLGKNSDHSHPGADQLFSPEREIRSGGKRAGSETPEGAPGEAPGEAPDQAPPRPSRKNSVEPQIEIAVMAETLSDSDSEGDFDTGDAEMEAAVVTCGVEEDISESNKSESQSSDAGPENSKYEDEFDSNDAGKEAVAVATVGVDKDISENNESEPESNDAVLGSSNSEGEFDAIDAEEMEVTEETGVVMEGVDNDISEDNESESDDSDAGPENESNHSDEASASLPEGVEGTEVYEGNEVWDNHESTPDDDGENSLSHNSERSNGEGSKSVKNDEDDSESNDDKIGSQPYVQDEYDGQSVVSEQDHIANDDEHDPSESEKRPESERNDEPPAALPSCAEHGEENPSVHSPEQDKLESLVLGRQNNESVQADVAALETDDHSENNLVVGFSSVSPDEGPTPDGEGDSDSTSVSSLVTPEQGVHAREDGNDDDGSSVSSLATPPGAGPQQDGSVSADFETDDDDEMEDTEFSAHEPNDFDAVSLSFARGDGTAGSLRKSARSFTENGDDVALPSGADEYCNSESHSDQCDGAVENFDSNIAIDVEPDNCIHDPVDSLAISAEDVDEDEASTPSTGKSEHGEVQDDNSTSDDEIAAQVGTSIGANESSSIEPEESENSGSSAPPAIAPDHDEGTDAADTVEEPDESENSVSSEPSVHASGHDNGADASGMVVETNAEESSKEGIDDIDEIGSPETGKGDLMESKEAQKEQAATEEASIISSTVPENVHALQSTVMYFGGDICEPDVVDDDAIDMSESQTEENVDQDSAFASEQNDSDDYRTSENSEDEDEGIPAGPAEHSVSSDDRPEEASETADEALLASEVPEYETNEQDEEPSHSASVVEGIPTENGELLESSEAADASHVETDTAEQTDLSEDESSEGIHPVAAIAEAAVVGSTAAAVAVMATSGSERVDSQSGDGSVHSASVNEDVPDSSEVADDADKSVHSNAVENEVSGDTNAGAAELDAPEPEESQGGDGSVHGASVNEDVSEADEVGDADLSIHSNAMDDEVSKPSDGSEGEDGALEPGDEAHSISAQEDVQEASEVDDNANESHPLEALGGGNCDAEELDVLEIEAAYGEPGSVHSTSAIEGLSESHEVVDAEDKSTHSNPVENDISKGSGVEAEEELCVAEVEHNEEGSVHSANEHILEGSEVADDTEKSSHSGPSGDDISEGAKNDTDNSVQSASTNEDRSAGSGAADKALFAVIPMHNRPIEDEVAEDKASEVEDENESETPEQEASQGSAPQTDDLSEGGEATVDEPMVEGTSRHSRSIEDETDESKPLEDSETNVIEKEATRDDSKSKSSWRFGLFSSKPSDVPDKSSNSKEQKETTANQDSPSSNSDTPSSDDQDADPVAEKSVEEAKSIATKEQEPKAEAPKPKSSWGFSLFSGKHKETESAATKSNDTEDVQPAKQDVESAEAVTSEEPISRPPVESSSPPEAKKEETPEVDIVSDEQPELAKQTKETKEEPAEKPDQKQDQKLDKKPEKEEKTKSAWGFSLFGRSSTVSASDDTKQDVQLTPQDTETSKPNDLQQEDQDHTGEGAADEGLATEDVNESPVEPEESAQPETVDNHSADDKGSSADMESKDLDSAESKTAKKETKSTGMFGFSLFSRSTSTGDAYKPADDVKCNTQTAQSQPAGENNTEDEDDIIALALAAAAAASNCKGSPAEAAAQAKLLAQSFNKPAEEPKDSSELSEKDDEQSVSSEKEDNVPPTTSATTRPAKETESAADSADGDANPKGSDDELFSGYGTDSDSENEGVLPVPSDSGGLPKDAEDISEKSEFSGEDLNGPGTNSDSEDEEVQSVSSDFRENQLSKAMKLLNGDYDDESVMTELESKSPAAPFNMEESSEEEEGSLNDEITHEDLSTADEIEEGDKPPTQQKKSEEKVPLNSLDSVEDAEDKIPEKPDNADELWDSSEEDDEDDEDEDDDSEEEGEDEQEEKAKVVVKEAPLLRLENVTSYTRSKIPESRMQKKGTGWGWGLFGGNDKAGDKSKEGSTEPDKESKEDKPTELPSDGADDASIVLPDSVRTPPVKPPQEESPPVVKAEASEAEPKPEKKKKKKKSKKAKEERGLAGHFSKTKVRSFSRHGDEVSVGTMNLRKKPAEEQQHVVLSHRASAFDDNLDFNKEDRPWDRDAPNRKPTKLKQSDLTAHMAIEEASERSDGSDDSDAIAGASNTLDSLFADDAFSTGESQDGIDALSQADGLSQADTITLSALENKLQNNKAEEQVNFDDMWDNMSADVSTAQEYEKKQRENFRKKKEKKKCSRKNDEDEDGDDVKRLRLFEKHSEKDSKKGKKGKKSKKKKEKLSMEFLTAIREVFDEDEEGESDDEDGSIGSRDDRSRGTRTRDDDDDDDDKSEISMFIGATKYAGNKRRGGDSEDFGLSGSDEEPSVAESEEGSYADRRSTDDDGESEMRSRKSRRSKTTSKTGRSKKSSSTSRSSYSRSSKAKRKPAEVLQDELKRQQGGKLLSVSSLRQEMSDRRGTSVELLKKEFERKKREKAAQEERREVAEDPLIGKDLGTSGFGGFNSGFGSGRLGSSGGFGIKSDPFGGSGGFGASFSDLNKSNNDPDQSGLSGHLSRWEDKDGVTDLDDLQTVQQDSGPGGNSGNTFGFGPPTNIMQTLPAMPNSMPSLPVDLLANGPKKSSKKKQQNDAFAASFDEPMPMTTLTELDDEDDNEMGLLASSGQQDDDDMSYRSNRSTRSRGGRFGLGLKAPKLKGIGKKFMSKKKADSRPSTSGFFGDDMDDGGGGLLG